MKTRIPSYRLHRPSGQAVVTLSGKDHYLGEHGTKASRAEYDRLVKTWEANGRRPLDRTKGDLTVSELLAAYWKHADAYYMKAGKPTSQINLINQSAGPLRQLYGATLVTDFGPLALKAVRQQFIDRKTVSRGNRKMSRGVINAHVNRIRLIFRWGVEEELIPESVYSALKAVRCLVKGRTPAPDHAPVGPAPEASISAILPILKPTVRAMVELQLLAGMRPGEVVALRARDIDRSGDVWVYRVSDETNKTAHHEKARTVYFGPRAQAILAPFLERFPDGYLFHPFGWNARQREPRKTGRRTGECYSTCSYYRAIRNACDRAKVDRFHPNQLRHSAATRITNAFGLDAARTVLGHSELKTTQIYVERDKGQAAEVARTIG